MKKLKPLFKVLLIISGIILLLIVLLFAAFIIILYTISPKPIKDVDKYSECLYFVKNKDKIKHFPIKIDVDKKDADLYCRYAEGSNYELVLLALKTDKNYIKRELKSHSFLNSDTPLGTKQKIYHMPSEAVGITSEYLTYYVLDDNNYNENEPYFPYFTGIGISKDMSYILYYYINPD